MGNNSPKTSTPGPSRDNNRVIIFDTTMRDGEQSPGASMNLEEKIKIGLLLEEMGVDVIEAGFPIASKGDFEAVREIAKRVKESSVCVLARCVQRPMATSELRLAGRRSSPPSGRASIPLSPPRRST